MVIAHNLVAMNAQRQYGIVTSSKAKNTEKLSSGYKINRAADDAAGLTISEKMRSQIRGLNQGSANIQDGVSLVQIADGALAEVNDMLHRMTELSIKSANGTNTSEDRAAIQKEIHQIIQEIDRIHESTEFNTMKIFDGDITKKSGGRLGGLVKCGAADTGRMTEDYKGLGQLSAILDFSPINSAEQVEKLQGKSFSFGCSAGCSETFKFKFKDKDDTTPSELKSDSSTLHYFEINISGLTKGSELVDAIYSAVKDAVSMNKLSYNGTPSDAAMGTDSTTHISTDGSRVAIGHANALVKDSSDKLVVWGGGGVSLDYYNKNYPRHENDQWGKVDVSEIVGPGTGGKIAEFVIQCSNTVTDDITIEIEKMDAEYIGIDKVDASTQDGAKKALDDITNATAMISGMRSDLGAYQNRLEHAYANNMNKAENTTAAESRIRDTDMAEMMMKFTKDSILAQATEAMMAQANQSTQGVLSLLQ